MPCLVDSVDAPCQGEKREVCPQQVQAKRGSKVRDTVLENVPGRILHNHPDQQRWTLQEAPGRMKQVSSVPSLGPAPALSCYTPPRAPRPPGGGHTSLVTSFLNMTLSCVQNLPQPSLSLDGTVSATPSGRKAPDDKTGLPDLKMLGPQLCREAS